MDSSKRWTVFGAGAGVVMYFWTPDNFPEVVRVFGPWMGVMAMVYGALHIVFDWWDPPAKELPTQVTGKRPTPLADSSLPGLAITGQPGISFHAVLRIGDVPQVRRKYLFDFGNKEGASATIFVSASDRFTFELTDTRGETYNTEISMGPAGMPIGRWVYLAVDAAITKTSTLMQIAVNGAALGSRELTFPVYLGREKWEQSVVGASKNHRDPASFDLAELIFLEDTLNPKERADLADYFYKKHKIDME